VLIARTALAVVGVIGLGGYVYASQSEAAAQATEQRRVLAEEQRKLSGERAQERQQREARAEQRERAAALQAAQAAVQAGQAAEAQGKVVQRNALAAEPNKYLQASDVGYVDQGIINDYRRLANVTVTNASHFAVESLAGDVAWVGANGERFGSVPFSLRGSIPAGATQTFRAGDGTLTSGTLQGKAATALISFRRVDIID